MSQSTTIMAFRKRARSLGYTSISIKYRYTDNIGGRVYEVTAYEPMEHVKVNFTSYEYLLGGRLRKHVRDGRK